MRKKLLACGVLVATILGLMIWLAWPRPLLLRRGMTPSEVYSALGHKYSANTAVNAREHTENMAWEKDGSLSLQFPSGPDAFGRTRTIRLVYHRDAHGEPVLWDWSEEPQGLAEPEWLESFFGLR